jgi:hypothetical protein
VTSTTKRVFKKGGQKILHEIRQERDVSETKRSERGKKKVTENGRIKIKGKSANDGAEKDMPTTLMC